jgi:hypothetical protein
MLMSAVKYVQIWLVCEAFPVFSEYSMPNKRWEFWIIGVGYLEI